MRLPSNPNELDPRLLRQICGQVNGISEGQAYAHHNAATAAPTTGTWAVGDFVMNSAPAEVGTGGMKYAITGWICTVAGTPGTWVESRVLTGGGVDFSKLLTATGTLDFASIAAGATAELTITVTGAATGDHVLLAAPVIEAGLMFIGYVSAANTVTVRLHNTTGVAIDPASASWRATVANFG